MYSLLDMRRVLHRFSPITELCPLNITSSSAKLNPIQSDAPFSSLPLELRYEIYRHLLKKHYSLPISKSETKSGAQNFDLGILSVSKATHEEATSVFYSESVFSFHLYYGIGDSPHPGKTVMDRAMNLEFELGPYCWSCYELDTHEWAAAWLGSTLSALKGPDITPRRSLRVTFVDIWHFDPERLPWCEQVLACYLAVLRDLGGFRKVVVEVVFAADVFHWRKLNQAEWSHVREMMEGIFVDTMGPARVSRVDPNVYLEFHPLEFRRGILEKDLRGAEGR